MFRIVDQGTLDGAEQRGAYMPVITPLADGSFIACQHVGSSLDANDCYIEVLRSPDRRMMKTYKMRKVTLGTVKKSQAAMSAT